MKTMHRVVGRARVVSGAALVGLLLGATGCIQEYVDDELTLGPRNIELESSSQLSPTLLAERIREIDASYAEPRTPARVTLSLETSLISISPVNDYEALWRGMRACAWLARYYTSPTSGSSSERREFALRGIALGQKARTKLSHRVETYYYLGQCQLALLEQGMHIARPTIREAEEHLKIAVALDASYDHCGPRRALGLVSLEAAKRGKLNGTAGTRLRKASETLRTAVEACPEYAENRLTLARVSIVRQDFSTARAHLEEVLVSQTPPDYAAAHQRWLEEANDLLLDLQGK